MDFIQVIHALKTIQKHCEEMPTCKKCRLHMKNNDGTCGVCHDNYIPARWEFDLESEEIVPSIFK